LSIWDPENAALSDEDREMGETTLGMLRRALEIRITGEPGFNEAPSPSRLENLVNQEIKKVGMNIANLHAEFSQNDFVNKLGNTPGVLDVYQGAIYHMEAFRRSGLPKSVYGGTPFGDVLVQFQADSVNNYIAPLLFGKGYCVGCDTHHRSPQ